MCIAIYKPNGVDIPDRETLLRCFNRNRDGAGFAIYRDNKIKICKGFMSFDSFYNAFMSYNPQKNENIFIHFRISTHGLVDEGNTHPFPVTNNFNVMRQTELDFDGKILIHNGVFHYTNDFMRQYDKLNIASDTMVFSHVLYDKLNYIKQKKMIDNCNRLGLEESIAVSLLVKTRQQQLINNINSQLYFSKVAIMNEDGSVDKYGEWIENNGVFYSNRGFEDYFYGSCKPVVYTQEELLNKNDNNGTICDYCGNVVDYVIDFDGDSICQECLAAGDYGYCEFCDEIKDLSEMKEEFLCKSCYDIGIDEYYNDDKIETEYSVCLCCGQNFAIKHNSEICEKCLKEYSTYSY